MYILLEDCSESFLGNFQSMIIKLWHILTMDIIRLHEKIKLLYNINLIVGGSTSPSYINMSAKLIDFSFSKVKKEIKFYFF